MGENQLAGRQAAPGSHFRIFLQARYLFNIFKKDNAMKNTSKAYVLGGDVGSLAASCINDWLLPEFFKTEFWYL